MLFQMPSGSLTVVDSQNGLFPRGHVASLALKFSGCSFLSL